MYADNRFPSNSPYESSEKAFTACFSLQAEAEPSVLPRILALFAKRGLVPNRVHSQLTGDRKSELHVDVQMDGLDRADMSYYAELMRNIVPVESVLTYEKPIA